MKDSNPYQPPRGAIVPKGPIQYGEIHPLFSRGRLGRVRCIGCSVGLGLLVNLAALPLGGTAAFFGGARDTMGILGVGMSIVLGVLAVAISPLLAIQRLRDFDAGGWWSLLVLASLANLVPYLSLLIVPGTQGPNRFGDPPPLNTSGVVILAPPPAVVAIGIVAAIALPVYQHVHARVDRIQTPAQP